MRLLSLKEGNGRKTGTMATFGNKRKNCNYHTLKKKKKRSRRKETARCKMKEKLGKYLRKKR